MKINMPVTDVERQVGNDDILLSITDRKGITTYANEAFIRISGFGADELIGKNHNVVRHPDMPPAAFADLWDTLKRGEPWIGIVKNRCKNGDYYWVDAFVTPVSRGGEVVEYQSVRVRPRQEHIERAQSLYRRIHAGGGRLTAAWARLTGVGIVTKMSAGVAAILLALSGFLWIATDVPATVLSLGLAAALGLGYLVVRVTLSPLRRLAARARKVIDNDIAMYVYTGRSDELGRIELAMKMLRSRVQSIVGRISESAGRVNALAAKTAEAVSASSEAIMQLQSETDQVATAMNEMATTVQDVTRNTAQAASAARQADDDTARGHDVVGQVAAAINGLAAEVETSAQVIQRLETESSNIGMVLDVIQGVAEQTNLLALNAAIEAARAGEQGRGFAVVADEVRTLASRTRESIQEIQKIIESLQSGAHDAVRAMLAGRERAKFSVEQAAQADTALDAITLAITSINDMNVQIASAAEEQSAVAEEINRNVVSISHKGAQTATGAQQMARSMEELARLAAGLDALVAQFARLRADD